MASYNHLTTHERELIFLYHGFGFSYRRIGRFIKRSPSTIMREIKRHSTKKRAYSPSIAQRTYTKNKKCCGRKRLLDNSPLKESIRQLFLEEQWSPEQISQRIRLENNGKSVSYNTIYRSIYRGLFNDGFTKDSKGARRKLRRKGKPKKSSLDGRSMFKNAPKIADRPIEAEKRTEIGHWEADTVIGVPGKSCIVTLVDRKSRFLLAKKTPRKDSNSVKEAIIHLFSTIQQSNLKTITPDRGLEFMRYKEFSNAYGINCFFADPYSPWQRGTNENTNGLLREYLPKRQDLTDVPDRSIDVFISKLNLRPKKCLGWKTPYEVFYDKVLHLI